MLNKFGEELSCQVFMRQNHVVPERYNPLLTANHLGDKYDGFDLGVEFIELHTLIS